MKWECKNRVFDPKNDPILHLKNDPKSEKVDFVNFDIYTLEIVFPNEFYTGINWISIPSLNSQYSSRSVVSKFSHTCVL